MDQAGVAQRVEQIVAATGAGDAGVAEVKGALVAVQQIQAWAAAQQATLVGRLSSLTSFPEQPIAETSRCSLSRVTKAKERADTLERTPSLADALADGDITADHVDAVTRGSKSLDGEQRDELFDRVDQLADVAAHGTSDEFAKRVRLEVRRLQEGDGVDRLERRRRSVRASSWTDADGMWNIKGRFDPVTAVAFAGKLDRAVETMFAESLPEGCPTDPIEKQKFLTAHALHRLVAGADTDVDRHARPGRPEFVVVVDADAPAPSGPIAEWSIPVEIPSRVVAELAADADVTAVVVRNGVVLHAPGRLDLGRTTRLANRAQRRALRALYTGCSIPGCGVHFDRCKIHHVIWWRHGGRTDLDNLLPVCSRHHTQIHDDGWQISLGRRRRLTLRLPNGAVHNTGPPRRDAA